MVIALAGYLTMLTGVQDQRIDYTFKSNLARFKARHWQAMSSLSSIPVQIAKTALGEPTGVWAYFDFANNRIILGSRDDTAEALLDYIKQFDVVPKRLQLIVKIEQPDRGFELKSTVETINNQACSLGGPDLDGVFTLLPRINADATVTVKVALKRFGRELESVLRIKKGESAKIDGAVPPGSVATSPSSKEIIEFWKPFKVEVRAAILDTKTKS
jgi:hypothetical protein